MSPGALQAPRGTFDVLPADARSREQLEQAARKILGRAGYGRIETPIFEATELFARGVGESTDVVLKQMYSFEDEGGRSLTLRPEGTAPVCRAYVEHGMHKRPQPVKLWYLGPFFRAESPQAGRFREFWQVGAEAIGSDDPAVDAESILLLAELLEAVGAGGLALRIASLGGAVARVAYRDELTAFLRDHAEELPAAVRTRIELNPLRAFDSGDAHTRELMERAPKLLDRLESDDAEHFADVRAMLDDASLAYDVDPTLVRGLDYYTRTVFEFESSELGAQSGVGGGGRYDGLVAQLGGPATAGCGWAAGIERMLLAAGGAERGDDVSQRGLDLFVAYRDPALRGPALQTAVAVRGAGYNAQLELAGRSLKGQLKHADRLGARYVVILEEKTAELKDMSTSEQLTTHRDEVAQLVVAKLGT